MLPSITCFVYMDSKCICTCVLYDSKPSCHIAAPSADDVQEDSVVAVVVSMAPLFRVQALLLNLLLVKHKHPDERE